MKRICWSIILALVLGAIASAQQGHRNYAKRQMTWFRREPHVAWLAGFGDEPGIQQRAVELVEHELAS